MNCLMDSCEREVKFRGVCDPHYKKWLRGQDIPVLPSKRESRSQICLFEDCELPVRARQLCSFHYSRDYSGTDLSKPKNKKNSGENCLNDQCNALEHTKGYCIACYTKLRRHGDVNYQRPIKKRINSNGYVSWNDAESIHAFSDGCVLEHRHIIGEELGRRLYSHENVHHKDGNKQNNERSNLELWSTSQPAGQRVEDKLAWAYSIIELYGAEFDVPTGDVLD